ncbi:hypothetical protein [Streptomyces sp. ME19-01-6]|uniref:hypothetical protein n=1 Tax=Streptomyces sp. ME19-01-6 TaxID=3028686 RepID=UPI0029BC688C|nr:hypothetical protein [Streptomyces sp. ME19-01-6]MDX3224351.1 hypothetical protein [Streptomyces sp. ME19-01-6]
MTDVFAVSIDAVEGCTLRGRVHLINPDVPSVPKEAAFPLALLVEAWPPEHGAESAAGRRLNDEFGELFDAIVGKKIRVTDDGYLLADDGKTVLTPRRTAKAVYGRQLSGGGHDHISRYVRTQSDPEEFYRRAAEIVTSYEVGPVRNIPLWSEVVAVEHPEEPWEEGDLDDIAGLEGEADLRVWQTWRFLDTLPFDKQPCADITVTVCDPSYLEHMVGGARWSTTHTGRV